MASLSRGRIQKELCEACGDFCKRHGKSTSTDKNVFLGSFWRVKQRKYCVLCRLVSAFLDSWSWYPLDKLSQEQIVLCPRFDTKELAMLCPNIFQSQPLGWIRLVYPNEKIPINKPEYQQEVEFFLGSGQISFDQVKSWLSGCGSANDEHTVQGIFEPKTVHNHSARKEKLVDRNINPQNWFLVDVIDQNLVIGRCDVNFVAMSYVWGEWGGAKVVEATKESRELFCRKGGLTQLGEKIPRVVRDTMAFVRGIGQRYLWCDLLCVASDDDPDVKKSQIEMMDVIYSEASLTIIALSGLHGEMGLPGISPGSRKPICLSETLKSGIRFVTRHLPLTSFYDQTVYTTRGWTFQEELLSRRCLYVTDRQMYFKCSLAHHREDDFLFGPNDDEEVETCLNSFPAGYSSLTNVGQSFKVYCDLLSEYSRRQLTFDNDIIRAFEGITSVLARNYQSEFWEGLPTKFLSDALLWIPSYHIRRRFAINPSYSQTGYPPTWSWAAWDGRVAHFSTIGRFPNDHTGQLEGDPSAKPTIEAFLFGRMRCGTFQISDICTLAFVAKIRQIIRKILTFDVSTNQEFMREIMRSDFNRGGWATDLPTDVETCWNGIWSNNMRFFAAATLDQIREWSQFDFRSNRHPDGSDKRWPFDYMKCLHPEDPNNWWPSGLAVPTGEQISKVLRQASPPEVLDQMDLAELPDILKDLENPREVSPPLCFFALEINLVKDYNSMALRWSKPLDFNGGQLLQERKSTLSSTFTTRNGKYDCNLDTLDFSERKHPLEKHSTWSETPATVIFFDGRPCGILFDFEYDIEDRISTMIPMTYSLIEISRTVLEGSSKRISNVMLVNGLGNDCERVAVGRTYQDIWWARVKTSWIRLH